MSSALMDERSDITVPVRLLRNGVVLGFGLFTATTSQWSGWAQATISSQLLGAQLWSVHNDVMKVSEDRRIIVVLPDNSYVFGSVPAFLLKGAADCPTWNVSPRGQRLIHELAPGMEFRCGTELFKPGIPYPDDALVVWFDKAGRPRLADKSQTYTRFSRTRTRRHGFGRFRGGQGG